MNQKLVKAVVRQLGYDVSQFTPEFRQTIKDMATHSIDSGFHGFIYTADTVEFFMKNQKEIVEHVRETAAGCGMTPIDLVSSFHCLKNEDALEIHESAARCLYGGKITDADDTVANALTWFIGEEVARTLYDEMG